MSCECKHALTDHVVLLLCRNCHAALKECLQKLVLGDKLACNVVCDRYCFPAYGQVCVYIQLIAVHLIQLLHVNS